MRIENDFSKTRRWVTVQAYKHDGVLHRQWSPAFLVEETEDYWALASQMSLVTESDGRRWMTKEQAIFILFKHSWMNVICMMKETGGICYYANIASPTLLDNGVLKYVDYDLDAKLYPDGGIKELDEPEFERHILTYGYPKDLERIIRANLKKVKAMMTERSFPFDDGKIYSLFDRFLYLTRPFEPRSENHP